MQDKSSMQEAQAIRQEEPKLTKQALKLNRQVEEAFCYHLVSVFYQLLVKSTSRSLFR
jgi:hypothetical protein